MIEKIENFIRRRAKNQERVMKRLGITHRRNDTLFDIWSLTHIAWAAFLGWVMNPFAALAIMVLWEPLEILVFSPWLAKYGIEFGFESLRNSLSDIFFDTVGVIIGAYIITAIVEPPFFLF